MASRKARKKSRVAGRRARGSRARAIVVLLVAAVVAVALYFMLAPGGMFNPAPGVKQAGAPAATEIKQGGEEKVSAAPAKEQVAAAPEKKEEVKAAPAPEPKKVETPPPSPAPAAVCAAAPLSLFDVQAMAQNPSMRFVDVRPPEKFNAGHIGGAVNIPLADFEAAFTREQANLSTGTGIVLYGEDSSDDTPNKVCVLMTGRIGPHLYNFREGWGRWVVPQ